MERWRKEPEPEFEGDVETKNKQKKNVQVALQLCLNEALDVCIVINQLAQFVSFH